MAARCTSARHTSCIKNPVRNLIPLQRGQDVHVHAMKANAIPLPRVTFMSSAADIDGEHVLWLALKCHNPDRGPYTSSSAVTEALQNSSSIMAAFCRADALPEALTLDFPGRIQVEVGNNPEDSKVWQLRRSAKRQRVLLGLAHASSDGVFVGTVDHVMVLPELQKQGLGRRLMNKVCSQLLQRDVTDIGTLVLPQHTRFFELCGFSLDKYNSVAMTLPDGTSLKADANVPHKTCEHRLDMDMKQMCTAIKPSTNEILQAYVTSSM